MVKRFAPKRNILVYVSETWVIDNQYGDIIDEDTVQKLINKYGDIWVSGRDTAMREVICNVENGKVNISLVNEVYKGNK